MKRIGIIALLAACTTISAQTQAQPAYGGSVLNHDVIMAEDFANLSQTHAFGTARSMAMGGAFTSLGADMSSMSLNPAGLGMYRRSEVSLTPMISIANGQTAGTRDWVGNGKTRFALANIGAAINVFESPSNSLTSLTLGFGMNRIADFNSRYSFSSDSRYDASQPGRFMPTIADVFGSMLESAGIFPGADGSLGYDTTNPYFWPAVLGYNAYMISPAKDAQGKPIWVPDTIGSNASVIHSYDVVNSGSINEFALSMGANISNFLYVGATLGIQSVYKNQSVIYQEEYEYANGKAYDSGGEMLPQQLAYMNLWQGVKLDGSGVNFKLGAIVRPVAGLRVGVAYHSPTFYSLNRIYRGEVESLLLSNTSNDKSINTDATLPQEDSGRNAWEFVSPSRMMLGVSYTFGNVAIVSVDYERDWYNGIRVKNTPEFSDLSKAFYKMEYKNKFCATNAIRAGVEIKPMPRIALRAGGGYTSSMLKDESLFYNTPTATESYYFTAGVGFTLGRGTVLDFAYQNLTQKQSQYQLFYAIDEASNGINVYSGLYDTKLTRHFISMTLGFRF